jgi:hypothetical protein
LRSLAAGVERGMAMNIRRLLIVLGILADDFEH